MSKFIAITGSSYEKISPYIEVKSWQIKYSQKQVFKGGYRCLSL